ncbi:MAG TPA: glycosyltransferase, partial [Gemmatimonadaceae bacterium]|nr:glycosyltransferase [Gemmatimonadaceae bacterium]
MVPDVSVSIVTHESEACIDSLLGDLRSQKGVSWEALIFDNASADQTVERIRDAGDVRIFTSGENVGYSKAHNHNIEASDGRYVLLLNPDMRIPGDLLARLAGHLDAHPSDGLVGPK